MGAGGTAFTAPLAPALRTFGRPPLAARGRWGVGALWRYGRGLARVLSWLVEISHLSIALAAVVASRSPTLPPLTTAEAVRRDLRDDGADSSPPRIEHLSIPAPASSPVPDEWRAGLQSVTWALIGVTLVLLAVSAMMLIHV
jgi:hypothetical protein